MKSFTALPASLAAGLFAATLFLQCGAPAWADTAQDWQAKGQKAYAQGQTSDAIADFKQALQMDPLQTDSAFNLGAIYYNQKRYTDAQDAFNTVLQHNPGDDTARFQLARTLEKLNRPADALAAYSLIPANSSHYTSAQDSVKRLQVATAATTTKTTTTSSTLSVSPSSGPGDRQVDSSRPITYSSTTTTTTATTTAANTPTKLVAPVHKFTQMAVAQEFAGGFSGPTGVAVDNQGVLYVANFSKNNIYRVLPSGQKKLLASGEGINGPVGLSLDHKTGDLYVANHLDNTVSRITPEGKVSVIATGLKGPYNTYLDETHAVLYVSQQDTNSIAKINLN